MAQVYKMMLGTSGRQWEQLTVKDDGAMTMTFHGTDREISHEVTENADGWLCYPGGMFPGLESGKWNKMEDVVETNTNDTNSTNEVAESETTTDCTDCTDNHAEPEVIEENANCTDLTDVEPVVVETNTTFAIKREQGDTCINHAEREQSQDCESSVNFTNCTDNEPRPRRQRKPRKPRVEHQPSDIRHQPSDASPQTSSTLKAVGMVAAATVALFVIYETGLLIPLGLIGLATGGFLK